MDEVRASLMAIELIGKVIGEKYELTNYMNCGKSALVFKGRYQEQEYAVKIFDPELVERFGKEAQLKRIERELSIKEYPCKHLIKIFDGGECKNTRYLFVVMECLELSTLESVIKLVPRNNIRRIIAQIAYAAHHLESLGLSHRDIKPSNIVITPDFQEVTLLDLGVLKIVGNSDITDSVAPDFVGTLRYSPPELLMRTESDTIEGWRAITFYQLGAVLHDLIMKQPIFYEDSSPYARLVKAVEKKYPVIEADDVSPDLISLARTCVIKDPNARLQLVKWEDFSPFEQPPQSIDAIKKRVFGRNILARSEGYSSDITTNDQEKRRYDQILQQIIEGIDNIIRSTSSSDVNFPPLKISTIHNHLVVTYPSSKDYQLLSSLYLVLRIDLLNLETKAIILSYWSAAGSEIDLKQIAEGELSPLFEGAYDESILKTKIEEILYLVFDKGQQVKYKSEAKLILFDLFEKIGG